MTIDQQHFGLTSRPFHLTPDPDFWFESATHRRAMAYLSYGLILGEGFIVITGEIGAGKTTLLGALLRTLDPMRVDAVVLDVGAIAGGQLLSAIAVALGAKTGVPSDAPTLNMAIKAEIEDRARMGRRILFIIDEAQALSGDDLERLRLVSNANPGHDPVIQFLLLGQPELGDHLARPALEQLRQRVIATHHLTGMAPEEVRAYIEHRMRHVGWQGRPAIPDETAHRIAHLTGGIPRQINQLMTRVLLLAALADAREIDIDMVDEVAAEQAAEAAAPLSPPQAAAPTDPSNETDLLAQISVLSAKVADLEARLVEQETALRHILALLGDWIDGAEAQAQRFMARS
jgi:general secretion pathway protein A